MELNPNHSIGHGFIIHKRTRDTQNFFKYKAPYLKLNLNDTSLEFVPFELLSEMQKGRINFNFQNTPFEKYFESYLQ